MKDKAARDAREAHLRWVEEETRYKYVEVSPKNRAGANSWSGNARYATSKERFKSCRTSPTS